VLYLFIIIAVGAVFLGMRHLVLSAPDPLTRQRRRNWMLAGVGGVLVLLALNRSGMLAPLLGGLLILLVRLVPLIPQLLKTILAERGNKAGGTESAATSSATMTDTEALEILGLQAGCSRQAVLDAHRRLIHKLHPDRGGSDYLAAKINQARDILLRSR